MKIIPFQLDEHSDGLTENTFDNEEPKFSLDINSRFSDASDYEAQDLARDYNINFVNENIFDSFGRDGNLGLGLTSRQLRELTADPNFNSNQNENLANLLRPSSFENQMDFNEMNPLIFVTGYFPSIVLVILAIFTNMMSPISISRIILTGILLLTQMLAIMVVKFSHAMVGHLQALDIYMWFSFFVISQFIIQYAFVNYKREVIPNKNLFKSNVQSRKASAQNSQNNLNASAESLISYHDEREKAEELFLAVASLDRKFRFGIIGVYAIFNFWFWAYYLKQNI